MNLTGRTEIWHTIWNEASKNLVLGKGYGGYWGVMGDAYEKHKRVMQSHNGYLEVLLQVGIVGLVVLIAFLLQFSRKIGKVPKSFFDWNIFAMCFLIMIILYNYTEASFIQNNLMWTLTVFLSTVLISDNSHIIKNPALPEDSMRF